ncbi:MAG: methylmalonyl-CoA mutase family protein [Firmicutes bacterium]|nr:methylmalonyl-CoA mutase family protein [Bacillota bacterium]
MALLEEESHRDALQAAWLEYQKARKRFETVYREHAKERPALFENLSGNTVEPLYGPDEKRSDPTYYLAKIGFPGEYPYTRGVHESMYRGRLWTMRMFAGFGTAEDTNRRFRYLIEQGEGGLSTAFDMPTLMGYDSDDPHSVGEVGREGVAVDSLEDMEQLFDGIDLDQVSTSMTINGPAAIVWAMYLALAEKRGIAWEKLRGTTQNDILKEYIAQKEWIFPPEPSMKLVTDTIEFASQHVPQWNPVSISGYHIREAGSTAVQELAFTLADGFAYVEAALRRGLDVDAFAPRLSFFFNSHLDFFEEIAKLRAARRIWATRMRDRYGAKDPRSWKLRTHVQTAGCSLTAQQPEVNIIRTTTEALAAVLGGCQSLHTNSMDEVLSLPTEKAVRIALRTQQVLAYETGVTHTVDPLAGSYYVEALTDRMEEQAKAYFDKIEEQGGVLACIENGFFQREIADAAYRYQREIEQGERIIVGVNAFTEGNEESIERLKIDPSVERRQIERVKAVRQKRDGWAVQKALEEVQRAARASENLMPALIAAVRVYATEGEIVEALKQVYGTYQERAVI